MEESGLMPSCYEGHDCFPSEEPPDVVAIVGGERIYEVDYWTRPDVMVEP